tara:strand:+ start:236 stop:424 length:189 start_codon:yes stop_codon:yes gene_type:complete
MKPAEVLKQMKELREEWRRQGFKYTNEQQKAYDKLLVLRRARVKEMIDNGQVYKGKASADNK